MLDRLIRRALLFLRVCREGWDGADCWRGWLFFVLVLVGDGFLLLGKGLVVGDFLTARLLGARGDRGECGLVLGWWDVVLRAGLPQRLLLFELDVGLLLALVVVVGLRGDRALRGLRDLLGDPARDNRPASALF